MTFRLSSVVRSAVCLALVSCPLLAAGSAQDTDKTSPAVQGRWVMTNEHGEVLFKDQPQFEFQFARLIYSENPDFARGWRGFGSARWTTDSPAAEIHLSQGIRRLTRVFTAPEGTAISLDELSLQRRDLGAKRNVLRAHRSQTHRQVDRQTNQQGDKRDDHLGFPGILRCASRKATA